MDAKESFTLPLACHQCSIHCEK